MNTAGRRTMRYTACTIAPVVAMAALLLAWLPSVGLVIAGLLAIPWLALRYDNESGTYFVLSVLFLFLLAIPALLLVLMALSH